MKKRQSGFTLIELLIVIAIIGILAAIAISKLLNAVQRGKQKRTMADMRTLATAVEAYAVDNNLYPAATCATGLFTNTTNDVTVGDTSFTALTPTYIALAPKRDGWQVAYRYGLSSPGDQYHILSYGRDGSIGNTVRSTINCGTTTDFNDDILYSNGTFLQWPE